MQSIRQWTCKNSVSSGFQLGRGTSFSDYFFTEAGYFYCLPLVKVENIDPYIFNTILNLINSWGQNTFSGLFWILWTADSGQDFHKNSKSCSLWMVNNWYYEHIVLYTQQYCCVYPLYFSSCLKERTVSYPWIWPSELMCAGCC